MHQTKNMAQAEQLLSVDAALADPNVRIWTEKTQNGRQGDVLIERLPNNSPLLDQVAGTPHIRRADRVVARGSRAAHVLTHGDLYVIDSKTLLLVVQEPCALLHLDTADDRHYPHVLTPGQYKFWQQVEATPEGVRQVAD